MKYPFFTCLFFVLLASSFLHAQGPTVAMQMTLPKEKLLPDTEYAELLVNILPEKLQDRIHTYYSGYEVWPLLILCPQGLQSADVAKAVAQTRDVEFVNIDNKYFSIADNIDFFSAIVKDIDAFLHNDKRVVVLINHVDDARKTSYHSLRIEKLVKLLRNRKILTILTAHNETLIDDAIMWHIPQTDIFDCSKLSLEARTKILQFCFKENIAAGIVNEQLIQMIAKKTADFSYSRLDYLVYEINHFIEGRTLQHVSEADVLPFVNQFRVDLNRYKNSGIKAYLRKVGELIPRKRIVAQGITDTIGIASFVIIFIAGQKILDKFRESDKKNGKTETVDEIIEQINIIARNLKQRLEAIEQ